MTIFDVIRYPISNPPTTEELEALPDAIYKGFTGGFTNREVPPYLAAAICAGQIELHNPHYRDHVERLHKLIRDHEE